MKFNHVECGDRIRILREERSTSQAAFAEELDISRDHLAKIELGTKRASIDLLINIANICSVSLNYLILGKLHGDCARQKLMQAIAELTEIAREL